MKLRWPLLLGFLLIDSVSADPKSTLLTGFPRRGNYWLPCRWGYWGFIALWSVPIYRREFCATLKIK